MYDIDLLREEVNLEYICACLSIPRVFRRKDKKYPLPGTSGTPSR